ncbi:MAG: sugar ABC transporter substrate-binding protein [Lachnospiraceae bacterium]
MKTSKVIRILLVISLLVGMWSYANWAELPQQDGNTITQKDTIYIWYTDEALTEYIDSAAFAFYEDTDVRVVPVYHTGRQYLDDLGAASFGEEQMPDLFIIGTDSIEKAAMAGLAVPVEDRQNILSTLRFPQVALDAVTYHQQYFGYPFYYETAFLLYNETYLREIAEKELLEEMGLTADYEEDLDEPDLEETTGDTVSSDATPQETLIPEGYTQMQWENMVESKMQEMIPHSITDILDFAEHYDAPEKVENIFTWDVNDIFYNYFFAGSYMNVGGLYGDDDSILEIYNEDTIECLEIYQELNQFFSIDYEESSYESVMDDFLAGKTIFTIATTDAISRLDNAILSGEFPYAYNVAALPGVDGEHSARGLSVTDALVINGYSTHKQEANAFAKYLVYDLSETLLSRTGKMPATIGEDDYVMDARDLVRAVYRESVPLPKLIELGNYWLQLEQAYLKIWNGADVNVTLRELSENIKMQVSGVFVPEEIIEIVPTSETEESTESEITEEVTEDNSEEISENAGEEQGSEE